MRFEQVSDNASMLYFENAINEEVLNQVQHAFRMIQNIDGIIDITPSYTSLLIEYDTSVHSTASLEKQIQKRLQRSSSQPDHSRNHIKIPTDYSRGEDIASVANYHNLSIEEVITLHTQTTYRVYAIGFMVGFAYLGTLPTKLMTPRLSTPRTKVPKGAVAIADHQTAVYPQQSAGGWNILGHTDFDDFSSLAIGDSIEFIRV